MFALLRSKMGRRRLGLARALAGVGTFVGALAGHVSTASAQPLFAEASNALPNPQCPGQLGCWTNYLRVTDIDEDGDLDILFPNADGYFSQGDPQPFVIYENDGSASFTNVSDRAVGGFSGYLRQVAVGDIDGDGDNDLYAPSAWGDPDHFFANDGSGTFSDEAATRLPGVASHAGAVRFGDVDSDGDLDLLVGDGWAESAPVTAHLYLNDGEGNFADATDRLPVVPASSPIDFDLADVDRDFDLDLVIDEHQASNLLWLNDGTGNYSDASDRLANQSPSNHYGPVLCDIDGDGDLDAWVDNAGPNYTEQLLVNDGTGTFVDETSERVDGNVDFADDNGVACADVDGDGDFDAVIMSLSSVERVLVNDGGGNFDAYPGGAFPNVSDGTLWLELGDLDGDGRLDAVTGQGESTSLDRVYLGTAAAPVDTRAPSILATETIDTMTLGNAAVVRFAVSDNATSDEGPRLSSAYVEVTTSGNSTSYVASFMGGDLFRATLPAFDTPGVQGSYKACAIDMQGNGGCSDDVPFVVEGEGTTSATGTSSATSTSATASTTGSGPATTGGAGEGGGGGASGAGGADREIIDRGCGCELAATRGSSPWIPLWFLSVGAAVVRSRRRRA